MKKNNSPFRYKNIFLQSSHQFLGNTLEYFVEHTEKLVVFIAMPRVENKDNVVRVYCRGSLVTEKTFILSRNIFLYYLGWYMEYIKALHKYCNRNENFYVVVFHPIFFFGMTLIKLWKNVQFVYWVGDYFPGNNIVIVMFEKLKKFYNKKVAYACYASDMLNKIMNGKVVDTFSRKTIMLGVNPKAIKKSYNKNHFTILFVGLIKESQGLEYVFDFLKTNKEYSLQLLGVCEKRLYEKYTEIIKAFQIEKQVYFPNRFFSDDELQEISKKCNIGIALYNPDPTNVTYYTDPGKVKAYTTLGLPVIMSNIPSIAPYITKFHAGEIVERDKDSLHAAFTKIRANYQKYIDGVKKFNAYFYYEDYYQDKFKFLED